MICSLKTERAQSFVANISIGLYWQVSSQEHSSTFEGYLPSQNTPIFHSNYSVGVPYSLLETVYSEFIISFHWLKIENNQGDQFTIHFVMQQIPF